MSKFKGKLARRIMAIVLSGAMVMSNMSAYAAELAPEQETEIVSEVEETVVEAESVAETAKEEAVSDVKDENAETAASNVESSESSTVKSDIETANTDETKKNTETVESTVAETKTETEEKESTTNDEYVKADITPEKESLITYEQGQEWIENKRTTSWVFNNAETVDYTIPSSKNIRGIKTNTAKVALKKSNGGLSLSSTVTGTTADSYECSEYASIGIPLVTNVETVELTISLGSTTTGRSLVIGNKNGSKKKVYHTTVENMTEADGVFGSTNKDFTGSFGAEYITTDDQGNKWLDITVEDASWSEKDSKWSNESKIKSISITETKTEQEEGTRIDWELIDPPKILSAVPGTDEAGKLTDNIKVTVKADIGEGRGKTVTVVLCDEEGNSIKNNDEDIVKKTSTVSDEKEAVVVFDMAAAETKAVTKSGIYTFKAILSRKGVGENDEDETKESELGEGEQPVKVDFKRLLTTPVISSAKHTETTDNGKGIINVKWEAVTDADYYVISANYTDDANKDAQIADVPFSPEEAEVNAKTFEKTLTVNMDSVVSVKVQAFRNSYNKDDENANTEKIDYSEMSEAKEVTITKSGTKKKVGAHVLDMDTEFAGTANKSTFSSNAITALGENNTTDSIYTSADEYFKLHYNAGTRIDSKKQTFDGVPKTLGINMQGKLSLPGAKDENGKEIPFGLNSIEFTVNEAPAAMTVYWYGAGSSGVRDIYVLNGEGKEVEGLYASTEGSSTMMVSNFTIQTAGTYYLGCKTNGCVLSYVKVSEPIKFDMDTEFAETANKSTFSSNAITALGENNTTDSIYTSADEYFKLHYNAGTRIDSKKQTFDGVPKTLGINMQGKLSLPGAKDENGKEIPFGLNSIEFTVNEAPAAMTVYWYGAGSSGVRDIYVLNGEGKEVEGLYASTEGSSTMMVSNFTIQTAGTYYLGCKTNGCVLSYIEVMEGHVAGGSDSGDDSVDWNEVADPEITVDYDDTYGKRTGTIAITVNAVVSDPKTDKVTVHVYDMSGNELTKTEKEKKYNQNGDVVKDDNGKDVEVNVTNPIIDSSTVKTDKHEFTYSPTYTSRYTFKAVLSRAKTDENGKILRDEDGNILWMEKTCAQPKTIGFTLPLAAPVLIDYTNTGAVEGSDPVSGSVELAWASVEEATAYCVTVDDAEGKEIFNSGAMTQTSITLDKSLEIGKNYTFGVVALRDYTGENGKQESSKKSTVDLTIQEKADTFELGKYILDAGMFAATNTANTVVKSGRYTADQNAADIVAQKEGDADGTGMNETLALLKGEGFADSNYFTIMYGTGGKVSADNNGGKGRAYPNNYMGSARIQLGSNSPAAGTAPTSAAIKFKTGAAARVDVYWRLSSSGVTRGLQILDAKGKRLEDPKTLSSSSEYVVNSFFIDDAGTYYIAGVDGDICIARMVVYNGYEKKERPQWTTDPVEGKESVTAPAITSAVQENGKIIVKATADIGLEASADSVTVYMTYKDAEGKDQTASFATSVKDGKEHEFEFVPESSNTYYFSAKMARNGEETTINSVDTDAEGKDIRKSVEFKLPLGNVAIKSVTDKGTVEGTSYGKIEAVWTKVAEAVYRVVIKDSTGNAIYNKIAKTNLVTIGEKEENGGWAQGVEGLAVGAKYTLEVTAGRAKAVGEDGKEPEYNDSDEWSTTAVLEFEVSGKNKETWNYANFGSRANRGLISKADKVPAGCGDDSLIDTDPNSETKGQKLADINTTAKDMKRNDYKVLDRDDNGNPKKVRVWSLGTYGKIVPNSTDGVSFYYTTVDPSTYNFTLSADMHVDQWTLSNGQEGFGLAVFDQVGASPDDSSDDASYEGGDVWNNSYMAIVSKTEYKWDDENKKVSNTGSAVSLKLGIESIARTGVTAENIGEFKNNATVADATKKYFKTASKPLDTQMHDKTYDNLIGNMTNPGDAATIENPITDLRLEIALNDTGYFVSYTPITVNQETGEVTETGPKVTNKYYDRNALNKIDTDAVYAGFFASRNAMVTFSNIKLEQNAYDAENAHPEDKEVEYVKPNYAIVSATTSNSDEYLLTYDANWHGKLYVKDENGADISDKAVSINKRKQDASGNYYIQIDGTPEETDKAEIQVTLNTGNNTFQTTFEPDENYDPYDGDPLTRLEDYNAKTELITVTYKKYGQEGQALYVAPLGKATGDGTKNNPLDIYTAVRYVQPGQTIYLMGENYDLSKTIRIERGANGTKDKMIHMVPDPAEGKRPVFDFHGACEGMVIAGDYWYFYGFDVTRSADRNDGIRVCGDYNTLDNINTYKNGNTGIQISRLLGSDTDINTDWPKYNTIKNCTSYLNADPGYEDADGFACKLTSGVGNKFIGCVAAFNADDGWDLYAKVETGKIGMVTIENCIAYKNGYVLRANDGNGDLAWYGEADNVREVSAGNGNGFKMGGSSLSGYHTLKNSLAFYNKAKGFDSNSCPDIQVYNSITFNNESYNIAFYTKGSTTDYAARGVISYRTGTPETLRNKNFEDRIGELTGTAPNKVSNITTTQQKGMSKIFNSTNYFFNRYSGVTENATDFVQHYTTRGNEEDLTCGHDGIVNDTWFGSVAFDGENGWFTNLQNKSIAEGKAYVVERNANGTINVGNFLQLTAEAGITGSGLPNLADSNTDDVVSKNPTDFDGVEETDGTIQKGDADDETDDNIDADDLNKKPGSAKDQVGLWFSIVNEDLIGYTGKALKPEIRVYYDNKLLTKKDYTVTYKNTQNAWLGDTEKGTPAAGSEYESDTKKIPTIIVKGKGNYIGQAKEIYFEIKPVDLGNDDQNRVSAPTITLLKANQAPKPVITFAGKKLSDSKDFSASTTTQKAENGKDYLEVKGKGNFAGTIMIEVRNGSNASKENLASSFKVDKIDPQYRKGYVTDYTGRITKYLPVEPLTAAMVKTYDNGELKLYNPETNEGDITIEYVNNIEIGTATAIITGVNNYYGTKEVKFKIIAPPLATLVKEGNLKYINTSKLISAGEAANYNKETGAITKMDGVEFTFSPTYPYEGKAVVWDELGVAAKIGDTWYRLTSNKDYVLSYRGNNKAGSASVVVKGKGNYTGTITQTFKIEPFDISASANTDKLSGTFTLNEDKTAKYFDGKPSEGGKNTMNYGMMKNVVYYDKSGAKPSISLRVNGNLMRQGKDYTITYKNNMKVSDDGAIFTVKGKGALTGTITGTYKIAKRPFNDPENKLQITATDVKLTSKDRNNENGFTGKNNTKIVVKDAKGKALSPNKDYTIFKYEYVDNKTFKVLEDKNTAEPITDDKTELRIPDKNTYYTVKVTLKGAGDNYTEDTLSAYYRVTYGKNSIKGAKFVINYDKDPVNNPGLANKYFYYKEGGTVTLNEETLVVTLKDGSEEKLLEFGTDYKVVSYSKNDRKGTAKLIIEGQGEYVEQKVITFKIGAQDFFWWTQPEQPQNTVVSQDLIYVMNRGIALSLAK